MARSLLRASCDVQLDFGAVPNGSFDNHGAFVSAIASKHAHGHDGLDIYVPPGYWLVRGSGTTTALSLRSGIRLRGAGMHRTILLADSGTTFDRFLHGQLLQNVEVSDLTIDLTSQSGGLGRGIEINGGVNIALRRVGIRRTVAASGGYGVLFGVDPARNIWIQGCLMESIADAAIRFASGSAVDGAFIQGNRITTAAADYLEVVSPTTDPDETGNFVTENGVSRWTSGGGVGGGEGPYETPFLGSKWQDVINWERVQYYKLGNIVFIQGACEVKPGEVVQPGETIFSLVPGYRPAHTTSRRVAGGVPVRIGSLGGAVTYQGEMPFNSWLDFDLTFRLGGAP